jgi:hypothetical protein
MFFTALFALFENKQRHMTHLIFHEITEMTHHHVRWRSDVDTLDTSIVKQKRS